MSASLRISALAAGALAAAGAATAVSPPLAAGAAVTRPAVQPGRTASPIVLDSNVQLSGYDVASGPSGNSYIGWISSKNNARKVHLCTLPPGARRCKGGIQTINSLGASSAAGLKVLVSTHDEVTLVWFHDTTASTMGPQGGELATATSNAGGPLSPGFDEGSAPSFGALLDARLGPGDKVWTVAAPPAGKKGLQIRDDLNTPGNLVTILPTPYVVGAARIRFHGSTAVLAIQKFGAITRPVSYASNTSGHWTALHVLSHTWTSDAGLGLAGTKSGIRLVTSVNNAHYFPVVWSWNGTSFGHPTLTGDTSHCSPASHDLVADASGRVADVSRECGQLAIANLPDTRHAAVVRFSVHGTFAGGDPQLTTTPRGKGWVVWSIEPSTQDKLLAAPILLPGRDVTDAKTVSGNRATVTGPQSCLPPVSIGIGVTARPAGHWTVVSKTLRLGGTVLHSPTLNGAGLNPGQLYRLTGTVEFANGSRHITVNAAIRFRSCPN